MPGPDSLVILFTYSLIAVITSIVLFLCDDRIFMLVFGKNVLKNFFIFNPYYQIDKLLFDKSNQQLAAIIEVLKMIVRPIDAVA